MAGRGSMDEQPPGVTSPPSVLPYGGGPLIACPYCGSPEFFPQKKLGTAGIVILIIGACISVFGVPCLLLGWVGVCPIGAGLLVGCLGVVLMLAVRRTVNRCVRCRRSFPEPS